MPELEFREAPNEWSELIVSFGWESSTGAIFHAFVLFERWVKFRRYECEEDVEKVNAESVCDYPALLACPSIWCA